MKRKWWIVGILVLFQLLVCGGMLLTLWGGRAAFEGIRFFYVTDTHIEETLEETFVVDGPAVLDLDNDLGDVTVTGSEGDQVEVVAKLSLWGSDEEDARRKVTVQMMQSGNRIIIRTVWPSYVYFGFSRVNGSQIDFDIRVPSETSLQLETDSGNLVVSDVTGTARLETNFGDVEMENVSGPVDASSDSGDIILTGLRDGGNSEIKTNFGTLILNDVSADNLTAHSDSGDIEVEEIRLDGTLYLETDFGNVTVQDVVAKHLTAYSGSHEVQVEGVELSGALELETNFGAVTVYDTYAASYRLTSDSGNLTLEGCRGPLDLKTGFGDIRVTDGTQAALTLKTESGEIYFSGSLYPEGTHVVESGFGKIHLVLPADAAFDLDAETDFGAITTDFAVTVTELGEERLVGKVNGGGPSLQIHAESGDITLENGIGTSD